MLRIEPNDNIIFYLYNTIINIIRCHTLVSLILKEAWMLDRIFKLVDFFYVTANEKIYYEAK